MEAPSNISAEVPKIPFWLEAAIVGGLGLSVIYGPPAARAAWNQVTQIRPRVKTIYLSAKSQVGQRLERLLTRKRKNGSVVRLIATVLPDYCFGPAGRIYIVPHVNNSPLVGRSGFIYEEQKTGLCMTDIHGLTTRDEDLIIAFELEDDTESTSNDGDDDFLDVASNADCWEQNNFEFTIPDLIPGESLHAVNSSTPKKGETELRNERNESVIVKGNDISVLAQNENMEQLMAMLQALVRREVDKTFTNSMPMHSMVEIQNQCIVSSTAIHASAPRNGPPVPPPPPPPPPPPMPSLSCLTSQPLIIVKKGPKECGGSAATKPLGPPATADVINAKRNLKRVDRSPGGTPIKAPARRDSTDLDLKVVLTKRFNDMQNSDDSDDDKDLVDKENGGFDDTFDLGPHQRNKLVHAQSPKPKTSTDTLSRRSVGSAKDAPFGPHLLKKTNRVQIIPSQNEPANAGIQVLRDRNQ